MTETGGSTVKDTISPEMLYSGRLTWADFQAVLDAYRDAAFWAGYRYAMEESRNLESGER